MFVAALQVYKEFKEGAKRILVATDLVGGAGGACELGLASVCREEAAPIACVDAGRRWQLSAARPPTLCFPYVCPTAARVPLRLLPTHQVGRGIDIERVNIVINYDMPETGGWVGGTALVL